MHGELEPPVHPDDLNSESTDLTLYADESQAGDWCDIDNEEKVASECNDTSTVTGKRNRENVDEETNKAAKADDGSKVTQETLHSGAFWYETVQDQCDGKLRVELKRDETWESGVVIVDGLNMKTNEFLKALKQRVPKIMKYMKPDDVRRLSKGGFLLKMKPEDCPSMLGWIGTLSKTPETVRVHPPAGSTNNSERTVFVYGVDPTISDANVRDCLLPPAEAVQRCYRDGKPTTTCKILYYNKELTKMVLDSGKVLFDEYEFLRVAKPNKKKPTPYCRTCKYPTSKCKAGRSCAKLRCGMCGAADAHKTKDCPVEEKSRKCIQCDSTQHNVFRCSQVDAVNHAADIEKKLKAEEKKEKKAEKKKAAKAKKKQSKSGSSKKSYAEAAGAKRCEDVKDSCDYQLSNIGMDDILEAMVESIMEICCDDMNPTVRSEVAKSTMKKLRGKLMGADAHIHPTDVKTQVDTTNYQDESDDSDESDDDNDAKMELCEISDIHEKSTEKSNSNSDFHVQKQKFAPPPP